MSYLNSTDMLNDLIRQLMYPQNFTQLNVRRSGLERTPRDSSSIPDKILRLPCLFFFYREGADRYPRVESTSKSISESLTQLVLFSTCYHLKNLVDRFKKTLNITTVKINTVESNSAAQFPQMHPLMNSLDMIHQGSWENLTEFLRTVPNLKHLAIKTKLDVNIDRHL